MNSYYLTTEQVDGHNFVVKVFNKNNNTIVYTTQKQSVMQNAVKEANNYLKNIKTSKSDITTESLTINAQPAPRRCCGR